MKITLPDNYNYSGTGWYRLLLLICLFVLCVASSAVSSVGHQIESAAALLEKHEYAEAIKLLHDLEGASLDSGQVDSLLAVAYLGRGYQLLMANEFESARESFQQGRLYRESDLRLWQGEAMALFQEGRYSEASSLLDQALGFDSHNADLYYLMGRSYYAEGRMPEALDALERAQQIEDKPEVANLLQKVRREWQVELEMEQEYRGHFQLSFVDGGNSSSLATEILAVLEDAYAELGADLNFYPDVMVPVLLYSRKEYADVTGSPDWSGGLYDGKIRLPLAGVSHMSDQFRALLYHEYLHVLVHFLANRHVPVWLNEGLAEIAGRRFYSPDPVLLNNEQLLDWQDLVKPFAGLEASQARMAYEQSYSLAKHMVDRYGWFKMAELLKRLGKRQGWRSAVADVYQDYGLDWPAILWEWQANLN